MYREEQLKALLEGHKILIAGYGREGKSAERLIQRLVPDVEYFIADGNEQIAAEAAKGYGLIIKSPGVPMRVLPTTHYPLPTQISSLTDLFLQVYGDLTIGVTGTKGKSTTASLIHHLLPNSILAGNIGIPLFDILDELKEDSIVVAELSCHQLENIHRGPHIAVLLNLFQEHLDHYESYMGYKMAKMQIGFKQKDGDHFFWCADANELDDLVRSQSMPGVLHPYSITEITDEELTLLKACPLEGEHNRSNALVACRVARTMKEELSAKNGLQTEPLGSYLSLLSSFQGLRHRMEKVGCYKGITWYDDSISTIPAATIAAVRALGRVDTLILGGFDRGIDYQPLVDFLNENPIKNLVFVGAAGRRMLQMLPTTHCPLPTHIVEDDQMLPTTHCPLPTHIIEDDQMLPTTHYPLPTHIVEDDQMLPTTHYPLPTHIVEDDYTKIVPWCAEHTEKGGVVLLSPAAASYDAFENFEVRGDFYREQIMKL